MTNLQTYDHRFHADGPIWRVFYRVTEIGSHDVVRLEVIHGTYTVGMPLGIISPKQWATIDDAIANQLAQAAA